MYSLTRQRSRARTVRGTADLLEGTRTIDSTHPPLFHVTSAPGTNFSLPFLVTATAVTAVTAGDATLCAVKLGEQEPAGRFSLKAEKGGRQRCEQPFSAQLRVMLLANAPRAHPAGAADGACARCCGQIHFLDRVDRVCAARVSLHSKPRWSQYDATALQSDATRYRAPAQHDYVHSAHLVPRPQGHRPRGCASVALP